MSEYYLTRSDELKHHGILGQKWGLRRFQNSDGSYTAAGKERYGKGDSEKDAKKAKMKKAMKIGAAVVGTALVAYGSYKLYKLAGEHADTILKGRLFAQKAKVDTALAKFDNRSALAARQKGLGMDYSDATRQANEALSVYNQHKNNYDALNSNYKNSSYIKKLKDANNLLKFNEAHGTSRKDTYKYLKSQIPSDYKPTKTVKHKTPKSYKKLSPSGKAIYDRMWK